MNSFRTKMLAAFLVAVLVPILAVALLNREAMTKRFTEQYEQQVESLIRIIEEDLDRQTELIGASLAVIRQSAVDDNRFRRAAADRIMSERDYLLDYADNALRLSGLDMFQIQDENGRIISSGHFRNEYDRLEESLPRLLSANPEPSALIQARAPDEPFVALVRLDSVRVGDRSFTFIGGVSVELQFLSRLARDSETLVELRYPGGHLSSRSESSIPERIDGGLVETTDDSRSIVRELTVPFIDSNRGLVSIATFRVSHGLATLEALRRDIDRWFVVAFVFTGVFAVILSIWLSSRVARPLADLAQKTSRVDLDRLDVRFTSNRKDEIGALSRVLGSMTERLRSGKIQLQKAEREATRGELARQVNHDIKNGLTPIRNVFRHLSELASDKPEQLPDVFEERRPTLDSSISYLESLASNYARLTPRMQRIPCNVNAVVSQVIRDLRGQGRHSLHMELGENPVVLGDPISLRRIFENLATNALESLDSSKGSVTVSTALVPSADNSDLVRIAVSDTGKGIPEEQISQVFNDFFTTKDTGTGLGLSIVRRLVMDMDGTIRLESEVGNGSTFIVELPAVHPTNELRESQENGI